MPESTNETANAGDETQTTDTFKAPATQADLDRIVQDRVARERAKYADYDAVKAEAATLTGKVTAHEATIAELTGKVTAFESKTERSALLDKVAKATGVPADVLSGSDEAELTAHAEKLKPLLAPTAPIIPNQAKTPGTPPDDPNRKAVRELFGNKAN